MPRPLLEHLLTRIRQRDVSHDQLVLLARWLDGEPDVPAGKWFKRFPGFTLCGEGELIKTLLRSEQLPSGCEVR